MSALVKYGLVGAAVAVVVATGAYKVGRWLEGREHADRPAEKIEPDNVTEGFADPEPPSRFNLSERRVNPIREGTSEPVEPDSPERTAAHDYAVAVLASEAIDLPDRLALVDTQPRVPPVRASRDGDIGMLAVLDSKGRWVRREWQCPEGRRWEAGAQDTTLFSNCERALPGFLPSIAKDAALCAGAAALGYGIAYAAEYDRPELVAGAAGGGCVLLKIVD